MRVHFAKRDLDEYSSRYTAHAMPRGKATIATTNIRISVPLIPCHTPVSAAFCEFRPEVKKSAGRSDHTAQLRRMRSTIRINRITIDNNRHKTSTVSMTLLRM